MNLSLMKLNSRLVLNTYGYGLQLNQKHRQILKIDILFERTMFVAECFIASLINTYDKHQISTADGGTMVSSASMSDF